ncbi:thioesterase family protein [Oscillatoria sp. FACHB-1406]|uniref:acyl-CoA thioesterase n=1 Tax=Oscillatoria sp. FACHB-1406 TaxID=2692846 RepID=UPI0016862F10|nr:thioesterase family protein [Oscillatoria sp. FACHB-1406]MBD2579195.1 acyl-CoA thioesterase [Oscillatoria sp. FACHB-1406]
MAFFYSRTVRLADTDAAGVIYFANVLNICHEAYEQALIVAEIALGTMILDFGVALPIAHSACDFLQPIAWGDILQVSVALRELRDRSFELAYEVRLSSERLAANAITRHVCICAQTRRKQALPDAIAQALRSLA